MIVKMKHLTLLCMSASSVRTLEALRDLGCVHVDLTSAASQEVANAKGTLSSAETAVRILAAAAKGKVPSAGAGEVRLTDEDLTKKIIDLRSVKSCDLVAAVNEVDAARQKLVDRANALRNYARKYEPFGDFDPAIAAQLRENGFSIELAKVLSGIAVSVEDGYAQVLSNDGVNQYLACISGKTDAKIEADKNAVVERVELPVEKLSAMKHRLMLADEKISGLTKTLAGTNNRVSSIKDCYPALKDRINFAAAEDVLGEQGEVAYIEGWIPYDQLPALRAKAVTESWGILVRDAKEGENPPTFIRPPKLFRPVAALFDALGIAPAYTEADVSVPFLCYFSIFFAMLVGDGGYGLIILSVTLFAWKKTKPPKNEGHRPAVVRSWLTLMTVFSIFTVIWGALSNAWFGASIPFFNSPVSEWLGDPSYRNMMFLCFTIGVSHLMLARIWNGVCTLNDTVCLSEFGWAGILFFMYWVTNSIVGIFTGAIPAALYVLFGVSLVLVFGFTLKPGELKTRGIELGMMPLSVMSALGDIISYVRLFAVGFASLKVAQNFNDMALGLNLPVYLKIIPMLFILLVGHGLNLAMAGLSVLVHAVRLNTLEFSNHKGISWSGYRFSPFKKTDLKN